ncbi:hypothetical protein [Clostridium sp. C8]|uniref:hypothetical protein n=1 Tax=Clostridium sp. C8 TaxID=1667357 RepID=UPI00062E6CCD|nr:hypothetical protein [Clostridium sp. C8]KLE17319.1 hypothetical protein AAT22_01705 [Clostridium sp. C8]
MIDLCEKDLEIITGGGSGDWDALLACGALAIGSIAYLASTPVSIPATIGLIGLYNLGLIGSAVSIGNILK